jgi:hypothetical protein
MGISLVKAVAIGTFIAFAAVSCQGRSDIAIDVPPSGEPLPFPDDTSDFVLMTTLDRVRYQVSQLEPKIGSTPIRVKDADERTAVYKVWKNAILSALAVRQTEGDTELMLATLAALYRQGANLDVEPCRDSAGETLARALEMYPGSMLVNWQAAYLYAQQTEDSPKAESALMKLRELLGTDQNYEVERYLAQIYASGDDKAKTLAQIDRCLAIRPGDERMLELKQSLAANAAK